MAEKGERVQCEFCGKWYMRYFSRQRFHNAQCRIDAYMARKRVDARLKDYKLSEKDLQTVRDIRVHSQLAADMILQVCGLAGVSVAGMVMDGVWDLMVKSGLQDESGKKAS